MLAMRTWLRQDSHYAGFLAMPTWRCQDWHYAGFLAMRTRLAPGFALRRVSGYANQACARIRITLSGW